jgi:predicted CopG family antitoxin
MPKIHVDEDTVQRLDNLRVDEESYDEIINELINIYEAEELTLFHGGDYSSD